MTQETQGAGFCDALAEPSPTDRQAVGRLSRKVTGEAKKKIRDSSLRSRMTQKKSDLSAP
jgi:hypothetical protein